MKKKLALATLAILAAVSAFAFSVPKIAHATNTCGITSPLLGRSDVYYDFNGVHHGGLVSVAQWGVFSKSNPNSDCIFTRVEFQSLNGAGVMKDPSAVEAAFFYHSSTGWVFYVGQALISHNQTWTVLYIDTYQLQGASPYGNDGLLVQDRGNGSESYFGDVSGTEWDTDGAHAGVLPQTNSSSYPT